MSLYSEILKIMEEELPDIGPYILKKQLKDLGIEEEGVKPEDIPRISRALSEASLMFGKEKAKKVAKKVEGIVKVKKLIETEKNPGKKMDMLMEMAKSRYFGGEWNESMKLFEDALKIAKSSKFPKFMAEIKRYMGNIRIRLGDFDGAERDFREAKRTAERIFDKKGIAESLNGLGSLEWRRGNYR